MRGNRWAFVLVMVTALAALQLSACSNSSQEDASASSTDEPAKVEPIKGTDLSRVTLAPSAAKRLGIKTATVRLLAGKKVIPYDAVLYAADGHTFTYTSPKPLVFVRSPITVRRVDGGKALLSKGPAPGVAVVTVGSQELYGAEYEVEED